MRFCNRYNSTGFESNTLSYRKQCNASCSHEQPGLYIIILQQFNPFILINLEINELLSSIVKRLLAVTFTHAKSTILRENCNVLIYQPIAWKIAISIAKTIKKTLRIYDVEAKCCNCESFEGPII